MADIEARAALDILDSAVVVADGTGLIRYANPAVSSLLGWDPQLLVGKPITVIMPERMRAAHTAALSRFVATGESQVVGRSLRLPALRSDGTEILVDLVVSARRDGRQVPLIVGTLSKALVQPFVHDASGLALGLARSLADAVGVGSVASRAAAHLGEALDWDWVGIWVVRWEGRDLRLAGVWERPGRPASGLPEESRRRRFAPGEGLPGQVWASGEPIWIPQLASDPRFTRKQAALSDGISSMFAFPVKLGERVLGVAEVGHRALQEPADRTLEAMTSVSEQIGRALQRAIAEDAVAASAERLEMALDAGPTGIWSWDQATGEVTWSDALSSMFGIEPGDFDGTFETYLGCVHPDDRQRLTAAINRSAKTGSPLRIEHRVAWPDGTVRWVDCRGRVAVDSSGGEHMLGVASDITDRRAADEQRAALLASERAARLELERSARRLRLLAEASTVLSSLFEVQHSFDQVAALAVPELAHCCLIVTEHPPLDRLLAVAHADPVSEKAVKRAFDGGEEGDLDPEAWPAEPRHCQSADDVLSTLGAGGRAREALGGAGGIRESLVVPLEARGRRLGILALLGTADRRYATEDLAYATDLARHAAVALDNANLYEDRVRIADALQDSLLPPHLPEVPGLELAATYQAAGRGMVGGDFYDVFHTGEGVWWFLLGDIQGKGPHAAAVTTLVRYTIRGAASERRCPHDVLAALNEVMIESQAERFATMILVAATADSEGTLLHVASAGHPQGMILRADGAISRVGGQGIVAGAFSDAAFAVEEARMGLGDSLVLFTDGVTDAVVAEEGPVGEDGLAAAIAPAAGLAAGAILDRINDLLARASDARRDDVAVLVLRRVAPVEPGRLA